MPTYIYGLIDPSNHLISYIGKTSDLYERWEQHVGDASHSIKAEWIKKLAASNVKPLLVVLDMVEDGGDVLNAERWWIAHGLRHGWPLTNTTYGTTNGTPLSAIRVPTPAKPFAVPPRAVGEQECVIRFVYRRRRGRFGVPFVDWGFVAVIEDQEGAREIGDFYCLVSKAWGRVTPSKPQENEVAWDTVSRLYDWLKDYGWRPVAQCGEWYNIIFRRLDPAIQEHAFKCQGCQRDLPLLWGNQYVLKPVICKECFTIHLVQPYHRTIYVLGKVPQPHGNGEDWDDKWGWWV